LESESKSDTGNNRGNWNYLTIMQTVPEQRTGEARHQGTRENSHIGHCTHTHARAHIYTHTHTRTRAHTHTRTLRKVLK